MQVRCHLLALTPPSFYKNTWFWDEPFKPDPSVFYFFSSIYAFHGPECITLWLRWCAMGLTCLCRFARFANGMDWSPLCYSHSYSPAFFIFSFFRLTVERPLEHRNGGRGKMCFASTTSEGHSATANPPPSLHMESLQDAISGAGGCSSSPPPGPSAPSPQTPRPAGDLTREDVFLSLSHSLLVVARSFHEPRDMYPHTY